MGRSQEYGRPKASPEIRGRLDAVFGQEGLLARNLPGFEARPGQAAMAEAVLATLEEGGVLAAEAETGIGKTLAYLVPAVLSGQKIVVSTGTLNLQDQILRKEIPFLRAWVDPELTALCVKGRQNYLCLHRWRQHLAARHPTLVAAAGEVAAIGEWLPVTESGDRAELAWLPDHSPLWQEVCASASRCLGSHCPEGAACFLNRLRKQAARARLLIVNHHLFFSDLAIRRFGFGEVLPRYESVIFDEAHQLESTATQYFGMSVSHHQLREMARDVEQEAAKGAAGPKREKTIQLARALETQGERFLAIFPDEKGRQFLPAFMEHESRWPAEANALGESLAALGRQLGERASDGEVWLGLERRAQELLQKFLAITDEPDAAHITWFERREKNLSLAASPLEVAAALDEFLYREAKSVVLASATLTTGGDFDYLQRQLGLPPETATLTLASPFDYQGRTLLYVPGAEFPAPGTPAHPEAACRLLREILLLSRGRALLLFTSLAAMRQAYQALADQLPYPLFIQGEAPKPVLLERFRQHTHSVLLAAASFWEGVDVPGEALSCVVIDKLPFEVPSDPVLQARMERIREEGGNPFYDFQIPRAVLALRQGLGRLMRTGSDRGLLAVQI
ncbi:MAG: ATP-dependent DNA helicase, partial [Desulfobacteraceae bacterium]|nr:ATP-dependent DNA helicase [Desulfobacteraceae bacterium]